MQYNALKEEICLDTHHHFQLCLFGIQQIQIQLSDSGVLFFTIISRYRQTLYTFNDLPIFTRTTSIKGIPNKIDITSDRTLIFVFVSKEFADDS